MSPGTQKPPKAGQGSSGVPSAQRNIDATAAWRGIAGSQQPALHKIACARVKLDELVHFLPMVKVLAIHFSSKSVLAVAVYMQIWSTKSTSDLN